MEFPIRKIKVVLDVLAVPILLISVLLSFVVCWALYNTSRLPTVHLLIEESSPDGKFTLKAYIKDGRATTSYAIRCELMFNDEKEKKKKIKPPADVTDFLEKPFERARKKSGRNYVEA